MPCGADAGEGMKGRGTRRLVLDGKYWVFYWGKKERKKTGILDFLESATGFGSSASSGDQGERKPNPGGIRGRSLGDRYGTGEGTFFCKCVSDLGSPGRGTTSISSGGMCRPKEA